MINGLLATHKAAVSKDPKYHSVLLRCMVDGLNTSEKYEILERQTESYRTTVLHHLVTKSNQEAMDTIAYLLDGLEIYQRQRLVYMKNSEGETVLDQANRNDASSAIPNLLLKSITTIVAPPSYEDAMLERSASLNFAQPGGRADNFSFSESVCSQGAGAGGELSNTELKVKYCQLRQRFEQMEKAKNQQIEDLTAKLRAAEDRLETMNLRVMGV